MTVVQACLTRKNMPQKIHDGSYMNIYNIIVKISI